METGPLDVRVLRSWFIESLEDQAVNDENDNAVIEDDNVLIKGYFIAAEKTVEPAVVDVLSQLDRRVRQSAA